MTQSEITIARELSKVYRKGHRGAVVSKDWRAYQAKCDHLKPDGTTNLEINGKTQGCNYCEQLFNANGEVLWSGL